MQFCNENLNTGGGAGRPSPQPNLRHFSVLVPRSSFPAYCQVGLSNIVIKVPYSDKVDLGAAIPPSLDESIVVPPFQYSKNEKTVSVPLVWLCYGRSGDKGDTANIGMI